MRPEGMQAAGDNRRSEAISPADNFRYVNLAAA